ncbi:hypothetical protein Tco_1568579 [Tanacetum coccineum]
MSTYLCLTTHQHDRILENAHLESNGFHEIIDFLNANQIRYALTVNPTIYMSCIEQLWATAKAKTVNGERQLQALIDKKKVIITKTSIRSDLHLEDAGVTQEETQQDDSVSTPSNDPPFSGCSSKEIADLKKRVQKLERKKKSRTTWLKRLRKVGMTRRVDSSEDKDSLGDHEDASKQGRTDLHGDEVVVNMPVGEKQEHSAKEKETLIQIKAAKPKVVTTAATTTTTTRPKARGVVVQEPSEFRTPQEA